MPSAQADRILHKALALLSQLGIAVPEEPLQARAEQAGFSVSHGRVTLPEGALRRYARLCGGLFMMLWISSLLLSWLSEGAA